MTRQKQKVELPTKQDAQLICWGLIMMIERMMVYHYDTKVRKAFTYRIVCTKYLKRTKEMQKKTEKESRSRRLKLLLVQTLLQKFPELFCKWKWKASTYLDFSSKQGCLAQDRNDLRQNSYIPWKAIHHVTLPTANFAWFQMISSGWETSRGFLVG